MRGCTTMRGCTEMRGCTAMRGCAAMRWCAAMRGGAAMGTMHTLTVSDLSTVQRPSSVSKITDVYNTMWVAYKKYLEDGYVRYINDAASDLEKKYQDDPVIMQFMRH